MNKGSKISGLFFISILLFLCVRPGESIITTSQLQNSKPESTDSYFSTVTIDFFILNRQEERSVSSIKNLPIALIKQIGYYKSNFPSLEKRTFNIISRYICHSFLLKRNPSIFEIIFPFHYYW